MSESKSSISNAKSYAEIGEYWDRHDLADRWDETEQADFDVDLQGSSIYFALERSLVAQLRSAADERGVSPETLLNLWVREKVGGPK